LGKVLVVDDETELITALCDRLEKRGYEPSGFPSGEEALPALREQDFDVLLTDLMMPEMDGITLLRAGLEVDPNLVGIIMTGQGTVQTAVEAMKVGAFDYVLKPFKLEALLPVLARAMDVRRLRLENVQLRETVAAYELSKAITLTLDPRTILHKVADAALQQCQADEVSLLLPTPEGHDFYFAVVQGGQREYLVGERVPRDSGMAGWVAQHREPLLLNGEVQDPRFAPLHPRPDIRSAISMPLLVGKKLVGVLNVNATHPRRPFTLGQIKALTLLTSAAAAALEAAWQHEQAQQAYDELRRTQEAAIQQERLRALGQMASGIAHDINNALSPIVGYASLLMGTEPNLSDRAREYLERICTAGQDVTHIVARMREFYRKREEGEPLFPVRLNLVVQQVVDLTRPRWKDIPQERGVVVDILTDLQPNLPPVMGLESEIREALTNLILNAVDAMPYKKAFPHEKALEILREGWGKHFDPEVLDRFFANLDEVVAIQEEYQ
jgi:response regulator RpfG family c-di-GMP phosphodiesterase